MTTRIVASLSAVLVVACSGGSPERAGTNSAASAAPAPRLSAATQVALDSALSDLGVTAFPVGRLTVNDKWNAMVDSAAVPRLYLMYRVATLQLPSGPITVTVPVTLFRFSRGKWRVVETKIRTDSLSPPVVKALTPSLADTSRTYAFLVRTIALIPEVPNLGAQIRDERDLMVREGGILLTNGLFGAERQ